MADLLKYQCLRARDRIIPLDDTLCYNYYLKYLLLNNCSSSAKRHCESKKTAGLDFLKYFPVELRHISAYLQLFARAGR